MTILSVHLLEGGARTALATLRSRPDPSQVAGMTWAETLVTTQLPARIPPRPNGGALIAAWQDEAALENYLRTGPLGGDWQVGLQPLRAYGAWPELPGLGEPEQPVQDDEPVAVVTLGRLKLPRAVPFLRASRPAEEQAAADPAVMLMAGMARPPRLFATFSVWRSAREMRDYAIGRSGRAHLNATRAHQAKPFHHHSIFARFRPLSASGSWHGRAPLT